MVDKIYTSDLKKLYALSMAYDEALLPRGGSPLSLDEALKLQQELIVEALRYDRDANGSLFRLLADKAYTILQSIEDYSETDLDRELARMQAQLGHAIAHVAAFSGDLNESTWAGQKSFDPNAEETHQNVATYLTACFENLGADLVKSLIDNWANNVDGRLSVHGPDVGLDELLSINEPFFESVFLPDSASLFLSFLGLAVAFFTAGAGASVVEVVTTWLIGTMVDAVMDVPTEGLWSIGRLMFDLIGGFAFV